MRAASLFLSSLFAACAFLSACTQQPPQLARPSPPSPSLIVPQHADFGHYTLALTWQPGFCSGPEGTTCRADQPATPLIGLHGLWASRPSDLIKAQLPVTTWWRKGCGIYEAEDAAPTLTLSPALSHRLSEVVAHTHSDLVSHEYAKHVHCFAIDGEQFFTTATNLRDRFADLPSARYLTSLEGHEVEKQDLVTHITADTGALPERGVQFQCNKNASGQTVLAQIWFTLKPNALFAFPKADAFLSSPQMQDNCPARFLVPRWTH